MDIIEKLKKEKTKWENRIYGVGETRIDLMIEDVIRELQKYQAELEKKDEYIKMLTDERDTLIKERDYYKARYNELSKIVDSMAKHIYVLGDYACLYEECDDNMDRECEDCIKEYFYKKVKETKDNGSTREF